MNTRFKYEKGARLALYAMLIVALLFQSVVVAPMLNNAHAQEANTWKFIAETIPDGTCYTPGALFTKSWTVRNIGNVTWTPSYTLAFTSGDQMSAPSSVQLTLSNVGKDNDVTISVNMTAPQNVGTYTSNWSLKDVSGNVIFSNNGKSVLWAQIKVATDCSAIVPATNVPQNGVTLTSTALPPLKDGEYRQIDSGHIQFAWGGITYDSTPSPDNTFVVPNQGGTIEFYTVQKCVWSPTMWDWTRQTCSDVNMYFRDLGLPPAWSIDATAERQFYSFLNAVVPFGAFGTIQSGVLSGTNGWVWKEVGKAESMSSTSLSVAMKGMARTGLLVVPAYLIMAGRVFVPVRDFTPSAIAVPVAPVTLSSLALQQPRLADAVAAVTALETTMGFTLSTSNFQIGTLALPAEMTANSITMKDVVITLPRGTTVSISFTKAGSQCFHKNTMDILFPWGKESFYGTSGDCSPWGWLEALTNMLKNWSERVRQIMSSPQFADLVAKKVVDVLVLKELIYETTSDLIQLVLELASYLIKGGF
jgi:hypothetical protein